MPIYHCSIKLISRSGGRSAIASAAYRSGEKLTNEETGIIHDFTHKGGVVMSEILIPVHAPERYRDRQVLWNEVQKIEKRKDAQLAREVEVALPNELSRQQQIECVRGFIEDNFVSKGMIADWALHDKNDGNPHAHIMLSVRGINENEKWEAKQRSVFANTRDEMGRPVFDPSLPSYDPGDKENTSQYRIPVLGEDGKQKTRERKGKGTEYLWERISIPANDWNDHSKAEEWRKSWAEHCNRYLAPDNQIDHRSYERQGIDLEPTIHEGFTARQIEENGGISERCEENRNIRERNMLRQKIKQAAQEITSFIIKKARDLYERFTRFNRNTGDTRQAGRDALDAGGSTGRDRGTDIRTVPDEGTAGRILGHQQRLGKRKQTISRLIQELRESEEEIAGTDREIEKLTRLKAQKEQELQERIQRLTERRHLSDSSSSGTSIKDRIQEKKSILAEEKSELQKALSDTATEIQQQTEKAEQPVRRRRGRGR